jgi:hypothetical protein
MRRHWDPYIVAFASYMSWPMESVDTSLDLLSHDEPA